MCETDHLVLRHRDDNTIADDHETLEPRRDGRSLGLVAQLAEQKRDCGSVVGPRIPNRQIHAE